MKVKLSYGHTEIIMSLSKLNMISKNFFYKSCSVCYAFWECDIKSESRAVISSLSKLDTKSKTYFRRDAQFCMLFENNIKNGS